MIKGVDSLLVKLDSLSSMDIEPIIEKATKNIRDEVRLLVPVYTGELRQSISYEIESDKDSVTGKVFTNLEYAPYVEFGTGPKGAENHSGISPNVKPRYSVTGWLIPVKDFPDYEEYGYKSIKIKGQEFIPSLGQKAQPFMYPGLNNNKEKIQRYINSEIRNKIKEVSR